jgi:carbon-monoxide dehydrogenase catalytic subunit
VEPQEAVGGFSVETIVGALGGTPEPLIDAIKAGKIRGAVGIVGCNNPKIKHDYGHVTLTRRLIENDILVVDTGCVAVATAKAGFKVPAAASIWPDRASRRSAALWASRRCCTWAAVWTTCASWCWWPPWPMHLGVDISDLPVAGSAPEWYSEKAVTIGTYFVASGVTTHLGPMPPITGSMNVVNLLTIRARMTSWAPPSPWSPTRKRRPSSCARPSKRRALGLDARNVE